MSDKHIDRRFLLSALGFSASASLTTTPVWAKTTKRRAMTHGFDYLTEAWSGPFGGVPAFDKVKIADFDPALMASIDAQRQEIKAITDHKSAPDYHNTIEAFEASGMALNRTGTVYGIWDSNLSGPEFQKVSAKMSPIMAAFGDEVNQNMALFSRISAVYDKKDSLQLTSEQQRLLWLNYKEFVRQGANLSPEDKKTVADINQQLASLFDSFSKNLLHDEAQYIFITKDDLDGLPEGFVASCASKAKALGKDGQYAIQNTRSAMEPFTTFSTRRDLREKVWRLFIMRGDNGDAYDNKAIIKKILKLRAKRAQILGYKTHAHWRLEVAMAATPENAMGLMESVWGPAVNRVHEEVADMQKIADSEGKGVKIEPWDYRFYAEKVRKERYNLDEGEIKPYLQLSKITQALFWVANKMYGFEFEPVHGLPVFDPEVSTYSVKRHGKVIGLWYYDPYAREGKTSGAWMNEYQVQAKFPKAQLAIVSNNCNFLKAEPGHPLLISWDDAVTMFHEFGHALHGLASNVTYPTLSGTNVQRDFVEFPSQLNEHWLALPEVLNRFALHWQTGEPMPQALQDKIQKSLKFNQGFATVEYLAGALIDMKLHLMGDADIDPAQFEIDELKKLNMPHEIVMRHRTAQFGHIFSGDGYSAGYYSYLWSDALVADVHEKFVSGGGPFSGTTAKDYFDKILAVGNTIDQAQAFRNFMGRDVNRDALMRKRGFA